MLANLTKVWLIMYPGASVSMAAGSDLEIETAVYSAIKIDISFKCH